MDHITHGYAQGFMIGTDIHVLKRSSSSYGLNVPGNGRFQYCCQDGCCDRGLQEDVRSVVRQAKEMGATRVIIRTGQRSYYKAEIEGLPTSDVSEHVGAVGDEGAYINRR